MSCVFCSLPSARLAGQNDHAVWIRDGFPVSRGHSLLIPRRHIASFFDDTDEERSALMAPLPSAQAAPALPTLAVPAYMGRLHQVALNPKRFQAQCLDSTTARYKLLDDGRVEVANRRRTKDGWGETMGVARPDVHHADARRGGAAAELQ